MKNEELSVGSGAIDMATNTWKLFEVPSEVFVKFNTGRNKFERWSKYLDITDEHQCSICDYAKKFPSNTVVLKNAETGALRQIRRRAVNDA